MCEIGRLFPVHIRDLLDRTKWQKGLEEIRIRIGQPIEFSYDTGSLYLVAGEGTCIFCGGWELRKGQKEFYRITGKDIAEMLNYISNYSLYAYKEEMKQGYITVEGGHRIGIAGCATMDQGRIAGIHHITFLNIRVAHEKPGCAKELLPYIRHHNSIYNTLLLSPPGAGKTTYLRDSIRMLSTGSEECAGLKVCVVDERSEIAACYMGVPQNDLGPRTDVLDGCGKAEGMMMLLRSMSPEVLAVDELGSDRDFLAVEQAVYSGSKVLGTIHAGDVGELSGKPYLRKWIEKRVFKRYVLIERGEDGNRSFEIYDAHMEKLC